MSTKTYQLPVVWNVARRLKIAGHCDQHQNLPAGKLVLWEPSHRQRERGQPTPTFVEALRMDAGVESSDGLRRACQPAWWTGWIGASDGRPVGGRLDLWDDKCLIKHLGVYTVDIYSVGQEGALACWSVFARFLGKQNMPVSQIFYLIIFCFHQYCNMYSNTLFSIVQVSSPNSKCYHQLLYTHACSSISSQGRW